MKFHILLLLIGLIMTTSASAEVWATATSLNQSNGRVIIFRYIKQFSTEFDRATQPDRVILTWKYQSNKGMPSAEERERMDAMEDALEPVLDKDNFATLSLVSTGENLREWVYYAKQEYEFLERLNLVLKAHSAFPIEVHTASDPQWSTYEKFKASVKE